MTAVARHQAAAGHFATFGGRSACSEAAIRHNRISAECSRSESLDDRATRGGFADQITSAHALGDNNVIEGKECRPKRPKPGMSHRRPARLE